jgi:anti-sigma regulatory factor (Ser/Thr protein kinase)
VGRHARTGSAAERDRDLLDMPFGRWDLAKLRHLVGAHCTDAGMRPRRADDFVLAVHEIAANAIVHSAGGGRLVLRRAGSGLCCMIASENIPGETAEFDDGNGSDTGRGLWLAAQLTDELTITAGPPGPDGTRQTTVSLFQRLGVM